MTASEDVFAFVAIRDLQRPARPLTLRAPAFDPSAPSELHVKLRDASSVTARAVIADEYIARTEAPRFLRGLDDAPEPIRILDELLIDAADAVSAQDLADAALPPLRTLAKDDAGRRDLVSLLRDAAVHGAWADNADSMLAATFGSTASPAARVDLTRTLLLWELLDRVSQDASASATEVAALLRTGIVLVPEDVVAVGTDGPTPEPPAAPPAPRAPDTVDDDRLRSTVAALGDLRRAARAAVRTGELTNRDGDAEAPSIAHVRDALTAETVETLEREGAADDGTTLPEAMTRLSAAAETAATRVLAAREPDRLAALVSEIARTRPWEWTDGRVGPPSDSTIEPFRPPRVSTARLLSPPVLGELKVVRQTLRGYELGEIAHVENVLRGERKLRRHQIVDLREDEEAQLEERDEEKEFDSQTTTRSELATETETTREQSQQLSANGMVSASYGPYFSASATVGFASSNSSSQSMATSTRYAQDLTERAANRLRMRTETRRRRLTRRTVNEENTHRLDNTEGPGHTVGVYRWLNKRYCAQVYKLGCRVLLEIGVSDPSANYRYAAALGSGLEVEADPPPPLVDPLAPANPLTPDGIIPDLWRTYAAYFRVPDFPAPPPFDLTVTLALASEAPPIAPEPPADDDDEDAPRRETPRPADVYQANRELTIPPGYQPIYVWAVVIHHPHREDTAPVPALTDAERGNIRASLQGLIAAQPGLAARLTNGLDLWLAWNPVSTPVPAVSENDLLDVATLHGFALRLLTVPAWRQNLIGFLTRAALALSRRGSGLDLAVGPAHAHIETGAVKRRLDFSYAPGLPDAFPEIGTAPDEGMSLPVAVAAEGAAGFAMTLSVYCVDWDYAQPRWQQQAYEAILAAHASWETDYRAAVAAARNRNGILISGRNPLENQRIVHTELKRSAIAMLGGVTDADLRAVTPGDPAPKGTPPRPTPPKVDLDDAASAVGVARFYEQAFEWENMGHVLYPYFWTGRDDWPEASLRTDVDPEFARFLSAGAARVVLPIRPGFELLVASRLGLDLPEPFVAGAAAMSSGDPSLAIADELRAAQDSSRGTPDGKPWPITLPTTLVALDDTPMPTYPTACDCEDDEVRRRQHDPNG